METAERTLPEPVSICVAPNGARRGKADHPAIPLTPAELAADAAQCVAAGASVLHLHVRDADGGHSLDAGRYREAIQAIKDRVGKALVLQITSEAVGKYTPDEQAAAVFAAGAEAASVSVKEMMRDEALARRFYPEAEERGIALQHILYSADDLAMLRGLMQAGVIQVPPNVLLVLGRYAGSVGGNPLELLDLLPEMDASWSWSVCGFGPAEPQCLAAAIGLGGHVRVGFENNLRAADGQAAENNAVNVANAATLAIGSGRGIATAIRSAALYGVSQSVEESRRMPTWQS